MIRIMLASTLLICTTAVAAPPPPAVPVVPAAPKTPAVPAAAAPTTSPSPARPATSATPASPEQLHEQALDAMRLGQLDAAFALMEKAYDATPAAQRTRPLVLNRAILDLTQRVNVMRAVRDCYQYLREHPEVDEEAHTIFGAALNVAANTPRWKQGTLWQAAYREWERRNDQLAESRPGFRRWGPLWLDNAQYEKLQGDRAQIERAIDEQNARVTRAANRADGLRAQLQSLGASVELARQDARQQAAEQQQIRNQRTQYEMQKMAYERQKLAWDQFQRQQQQKSGQPPPPPPPPVAQQPAAGTTAPPPTIIMPNAGTFTGGGIGAGGAYTNGPTQEMARVRGELVIADRELQVEKSRLAEIQRGLAGLLRPTWPTTFDPIELTALAPPALPPPDPNAIAAVVAQAEKEVTRSKSPFAESGGARRQLQPQQQQPAPQPAPPAQQPPQAQPQVQQQPATGNAPPSPATTPPPAVPFGPRPIDTPGAR